MLSNNLLSILGNLKTAEAEFLTGKSYSREFPVIFWPVFMAITSIISMSGILAILIKKGLSDRAHKNRIQEVHITLEDQNENQEYSRVQFLGLLSVLWYEVTLGRNHRFGRPTQNPLSDNWGIKFFSQLRDENYLSSFKRGPGQGLSYTGLAKPSDSPSLLQILMFWLGMNSLPLLR